MDEFNLTGLIVIILALVVVGFLTMISLSLNLQPISHDADSKIPIKALAFCKNCIAIGKNAHANGINNINLNCLDIIVNEDYYRHLLLNDPRSELWQMYKESKDYCIKMEELRKRL